MKTQDGHGCIERDHELNSHCQALECRSGEVEGVLSCVGERIDDDDCGEDGRDPNRGGR